MSLPCRLLVEHTIGTKRHKRTPFWAAFVTPKERSALLAGEWASQVGCGGALGDEGQCITQVTELVLKE